MPGHGFVVASLEERWVDPVAHTGRRPVGVVHAVAAGEAATLCDLGLRGLALFEDLDFDVGRRARCPRCAAMRLVRARSVPRPAS